jgi:hypothetical protein
MRRISLDREIFEEFVAKRIGRFPFPGRSGRRLLLGAAF